MIKLLACVFMLIDHIGMVLFPSTPVLRIIGRLSMPLFAFCVARGYYYSQRKGTLKLYIRRMIIFTLVSQLPFMLMTQSTRGNIGVVWLLGLIFLSLIESGRKGRKTPLDFVLAGVIVIIAIIVPMDYGLYGLLFLILFYYFAIKEQNVTALYIGYGLVLIVSFLKGIDNGLMQLFTFPCLLLIDNLKKFDNIVKINKNFFYIFYPAHMVVLVFVKWLL